MAAFQATSLTLYLLPLLQHFRIHNADICLIYNQHTSGVLNALLAKIRVLCQTAALRILKYSEPVTTWDGTVTPLQPNLAKCNFTSGSGADQANDDRRLESPWRNDSP